jgi:hypothetical protein
MDSVFAPACIRAMQLTVTGKLMFLEDKAHSSCLGKRRGNVLCAVALVVHMRYCYYCYSWNRAGKQPLMMRKGCWMSLHWTRAVNTA